MVQLTIIKNTLLLVYISTFANRPQYQYQKNWQNLFQKTPKKIKTVARDKKEKILRHYFNPT